MKMLAKALLSIVAFITLASCSGSDNLLIWEEDSRYHPAVGKVEVTCGDATFTPLSNFISDIAFMNGSWGCGDGMSLLLNENNRKVLDQKLTVVKYSPEVSVKIIDGIGHLVGYTFYDKDSKQIGYGNLGYKTEGVLVMPNDNRISYVRLDAGWSALLPPPGEKQRESQEMEYIFKVKFQ